MGATPNVTWESGGEKKDSALTVGEMQGEYFYLEQQVADWIEQLKFVTDKQKTIDYKFLLAEAYANLGDYLKAQKELKDIYNLAKEIEATEAISLVLEKQGNIEISLGNLDEGISLYQQSVKTNKNLPSVSVLNNLVESLKRRKQALEFNKSQSRRQKDKEKYTKQIERDGKLIKKYSSLAISNKQRKIEKEIKVDAEQTDSLSNAIALIEWQTNDSPLSQEQINRISKILGDSPATRKLIFTLIAWSRLDNENKVAWLFKAKQAARAIDDLYAQSYVETELAEFYYKNGRFKEAITSAITSQNMAQSIFAYDSLFRSQSLAGKIHQKMDRKERAIDSYRGAIASLDNSIEYVQRANFKTELEPVYRNALKLLLDSIDPPQENLVEAINISDKIRLLQLKQYFGDDCIELINNNEKLNKKSSEQTAVINSIILDDRTHFIVEMPNGKIKYSSVEIDKEKLNDSAQKWRKQLTKGYTWEFQEESRFFYSLIIKPLEKELEKSNIEKIVFIHDGILRNLPMSALYDGKKYLVERWVPVSSLGLQISYEELQKAEEVLAFGLKKPSAEFSSWGKLENAIEEIKRIKELVGAEIYTDEKFTSSNLLKLIEEEEYSILHLATHGYFSGNAETSFLLTSNGKITALELEQILKQSKQTLELLVLSACETAVGSEESLLGLAGIAARSGVRSVLGSLWQVDDNSQVQLIEAFYREKASGDTKNSTALAQAQKDKIEKLSHPREWAAIVLIE